MLRPVVEGLGYELVGIEHRSGARGLLRVYIDHAPGVTVDDCERVSRQVSAVLDVEDPIAGEYDLEVSSPGLDRPLFEGAHFERFTGQRARVKLAVPLAGRRRFSGVIGAVRERHVVLIDGGEEHVLPLGIIASARLVPEEVNGRQGRSRRGEQGVRADGEAEDAG